MPEVTRDILYFDVCLVYLVALFDQLPASFVVIMVIGYTTKIYSVYCTTVNVAD